MKTTRTYTMTARAQAAEATRTRIREALFDLGTTPVFADISLDDVAQEAGVSVQTVLRHFGSRAAPRRRRTSSTPSAGSRTSAWRPEGDVDAALAVLIVDHYERRGDTALLMLAQEGTDETGPPADRERTSDAPRLGADRVRAVPARRGAAREARVDLLVVATDVYTWKLLRRDRGLLAATPSSGCTSSWPR